MEITVKHNHISISPRKARVALFGLRGEKAESALDVVNFTRKKISPFVAKLIKSGLAAAKENDLSVSEMYIKSIVCNEGPRLKRRRFESKGQSKRITKRTSHLVLTLSDEIIGAGKPSKKLDSKTKGEKSEVKSASRQTESETKAE